MQLSRMPSRASVIQQVKYLKGYLFTKLPCIVSVCKQTKVLADTYHSYLLSKRCYTKNGQRNRHPCLAKTNTVACD